MDWLVGGLEGWIVVDFCGNYVLGVVDCGDVFVFGGFGQVLVEVQFVLVFGGDIVGCYFKCWVFEMLYEVVVFCVDVVMVEIDQYDLCLYDVFCFGVVRGGYCVGCYEQCYVDVVGLCCLK